MNDAPTRMELESLYQDLKAHHMDALWRMAPELHSSTPRQPGVGHVWSWSEIEPLLQRSGHAMTPEAGAERRALMLVNPGLPASPAATLMTTVQMILPGEIAPSHRHSMSAFRFILKGSGSFTDVEGERIFMEPGDLILTPAWTWHYHGNTTEEPIIWFDGLDAPMVRAIKAEFIERGGEGLDAKPAGYTRMQMGNGLVRPLAQEINPKGTPMVYPWAEVYPELMKRRDVAADPYIGIAMRYADPVTGGSTMRTLDCRLHLLPAHHDIKARRHTGNLMFYIVHGSGASVVNGRELAWSQGDFLVVPTWSWYEHHNTGSDDAILFSFTEAPALQALGLYREERCMDANGFQAISQEPAS